MTLAGCGAVSSKNETPKVPSEEASSPALTPPVAPVSLEEPTPADETIHVSTAGEFLEAIAPGASEKHPEPAHFRREQPAPGVQCPGQARK